MTDWLKEQKKKQNVAEKRLKDLMDVFENRQILKATLEYTGYGDGGDQWELIFYDKSNNALEFPSYVNATKKARLQEDLNVSSVEIDDLNTSLEDLLTYDWYNNEGGGGTMEIDFVKKTINLDAYYNEVIQEPAGNDLQKSSWNLK